MVPSSLFRASLLALSLLPALTRAESLLSLDEAARLAQDKAPLLQAQGAAIRAAQQSAVSAAQLPDPVLVGGISDLTLTGADQYTLRRESDTQFQVGLRQDFPGGDKRALRGARGQREAERLQAEWAEQQRMLAREAGLAWIEVWKALRAQALAQATLDELQHQLEAADIAYRAGRIVQADLLAARVAREMGAEQLAALRQAEGHARNLLRRWLPADADRAIDPVLPDYPAPDLDALLATLDRHPHVTAQNRAVAVADAELDLARAEYRPDWSAQLSYGHRPEFADYASLSFEVGLPAFTRDRQDRDVAAKAEAREAAEQARQDWLRQHRAELQLNVQDWQRLQDRFTRYDTLILPAAQARLEAARAAFGAGSGTLMAVFDARRALLELALQRLDLEADAARHQVNLRYFDHGAAPADAAS